MRVAYLCVLAGLMVIMVGARLKQAPPDLSSPKATVQSLLEAYSKHDFAGMAQCVAGGKAEGITDFVGTRMLPFTNAAGKNYIVETNGDTAKVGLEIDLTADVQAQRVTITLPELLTLKKADVGWQIVADKISIEKDGMSLQMRPLKLLIAMLDPANRQVMEAAHAQAESASCLSNVKQLGLGAMMYTQDYDDVLPRRAAEYKNLLFPYVKNEAIFHCALDAKGTISYSMNVAIQGMPLAAIADPAHTVLLYEGKDGKVNYRHEGRAAVAFVDGHAKLMTEAEMSTAIWKVKYTPPAPKKAHKKSATHHK